MIAEMQALFDGYRSKMSGYNLNTPKRQALQLTPPKTLPVRLETIVRSPEYVNRRGCKHTGASLAPFRAMHGAKHAVRLC